MDLRNRKLTSKQLSELHRFIRQRKLAYQPFVFTDSLQVGEGQKFRDGEFAQRCGNVLWTGNPPDVDDLITRDAASFQEANRELRKIYDGMVEFIVRHVGEDVAQLSFAEFGCNTGYFLHSLAARGARKTTGYDFTENSEVFEWFNKVLGIGPGRNEFRFAEWDSLNHRVLHTEFDEADVCLSVAVTCHLADPLHHLAFLCSKARKAVFFWCPVTETNDLSLSFGAPAKYPNSLAFPINFDNDVRFSPALLRLTLESCGFGNVAELPLPNVSPAFTRWFKNQKGFVALRTSKPATIYTGGLLHRELPCDAPPDRISNSSASSLDRFTDLVQELVGAQLKSSPPELVIDHPKPKAKVSVILLDWGVRESFHSLRYLNEQTVDRSQYELIWIEFYDRKPQALFGAVRAAEKAGRPLLDKLVVMKHPQDYIFHKHRMYNLGVVLSEGEICVICDSDAMFTPTFIERVIAAFEREPCSVVHLDEVRSASRDFYPFNYPTFEEFLASECSNWTGWTTKGLAGSKDMLHEANYGACLAARRSDIIRIGGCDEHLDYLGYICGPYDLTFRLVNAGCKERWLQDEFLYHTWHPGESGINIEYHGPSDGRGMSSRALEARQTGRIEPALENRAIRALRHDPGLDRRAALELLESPDDVQWHEKIRMRAADAPPRLIQKALRGSYDIYLHCDCWYAVPTSNEPFHPNKAKAGLYTSCFRAHSREELERWIRHAPSRSVARELMLGAFRRARRLAQRGTQAFSFQASGASDSGTNPRRADLTVKLPRHVRSNFRGYNIIHFDGAYYGVLQAHGPFRQSAAVPGPGCPYLCGRSVREVKRLICKRVPFQPREQIYTSVWLSVRAMRRWRTRLTDKFRSTNSDLRRGADSPEFAIDAAIQVAPETGSTPDRGRRATVRETEFANSQTVAQPRTK